MPSLPDSVNTLFDGPRKERFHIKKPVTTSLKVTSGKYKIMNRSTLLVGVFSVAPFFSNAQAEAPKAAAKTEKIVWHGTWKGGLAEAQRTGKPIMLVSAVPQCHSVPGVW